MTHLQGKVALVIGGSGGIGAASASLLAEQGVSVVITYLKNSLAANQLLEQIQAKGGTALATRVDLYVAAECEQLVNTVKRTYACHWPPYS